jgi:hypothetical protein
VVRILLDSGASHDFIAAHLLDRLSIPADRDAQLSVRLGNGDQQDGSFKVPRLSYRINSYKNTRGFIVTQLSQYDIILGKPWLSAVNPQIDWASNVVRFSMVKTHIFWLQSSIARTPTQWALSR